MVGVVVNVDHVGSICILLGRKHFGRNQCALRNPEIVVCITRIIIREIHQIAEPVFNCKPFKLHSQIIFPIDNLQPYVMVNGIVRHGEVFAVSFNHLCIEGVFSIRQIIDVPISGVFQSQPFNGFSKFFNFRVYLFLAGTVIDRNHFCAVYGVL